MILSTTGRTPLVDAGRCSFVALALVIALGLNSPLSAQGLQSEKAIDAIVGSKVKTEEVGAGAASERVVAAIDATAENAERVRKTFSLDEIDIVFLPDLEDDGNDIGEAIAKHENEITLLRESIEGSALFFHAVDSRSIQLRDVVALEYADNGAVTIFVKGGANGN
ncbi:hypothetical protein AB2N04_03315 [Nitratireductor sp. GISD-1A_MAKvit]|uniref:hypothetical protein n=1 Tax=Nitratireductor sp. GISD-1A_MAKvit TaxID=3234198 RepID=UPI003466F399